MKLVKILDIVNQIEKSSFFKMLDSLSETVKENDGVSLVPDGGSKCVNDACQIKELFDRLAPLYQSVLSERIDFDPQLLVSQKRDPDRTVTIILITELDCLFQLSDHGIVPFKELNCESAVFHRGNPSINCPNFDEQVNNLPSFRMVLVCLCFGWLSPQ